MNETLECDIPIYDRPYFVFDPVDLRRYGGVFQRLIFGLDGTVVTNGDGQQIELATTDISLLADAAFWSVVVILVTVVLLSISCCCQCCVACVCSAQDKKEKPVLLKASCGILAWILAALIMVGLAAILWSETTLDAGVVMHYNSTLRFAEETLSSPYIAAAQYVLQLFYSFQLYRHWLSIAFAGFGILVMLLVLMVVCLCTPVRKSMSPMITVIIVTCLLAFAVSLIAATTFFSLFYMSYLCYDLYRIGGTARCNNPSFAQDSLSLQLFCGTSAYIPHLITVGIYFLVLILLAIWQIVAAMYAGTFSRPRNPRQQVVQGNEHHESDNVSEHEMVTTTVVTTEYVQPAPPRNPYYNSQYVAPLNSFQPHYEPVQPQHAGFSGSTAPPPHYEDLEVTFNESNSEQVENI